MQKINSSNENAAKRFKIDHHLVFVFVFSIVVSDTLIASLTLLIIIWWCMYVSNLLRWCMYVSNWWCMYL